jgi:hypothetical protein
LAFNLKCCVHFIALFAFLPHTIRIASRNQLIAVVVVVVRKKYDSGRWHNGRLAFTSTLHKQ